METHTHLLKIIALHHAQMSLSLHFWTHLCTQTHTSKISKVSSPRMINTINFLVVCLYASFFLPLLTHAPCLTSTKITLSIPFTLPISVSSCLYVFYQNWTILYVLFLSPLFPYILLWTFLSLLMVQHIPM